MHLGKRRSHCLWICLQGNIARFINHSCNPNTVKVLLLKEHNDVRFASVGFFACKDILPNNVRNILSIACTMLTSHDTQQVTFDYGVRRTSNPEQVVRCSCGSSSCRRRLYL